MRKVLIVTARKRAQILTVSMTRYFREGGGFELASGYAILAVGVGV